jgi:RHS repeat-associated protein
MESDTDAVTGFITYSTATETVSDPEGPLPPRGGLLPTCTITTNSNWTYYDSFGTAHQFSGSSSKLLRGDGDTCPSGSPSFSSTATDGSGYTLSVSLDTHAIIETARGQEVVPPILTTGSGTVTGAGTVTDANGNQLSVDASGHFTDTTGNVALTVGGGAPSPKTFTYKDTSGNPQSVTVTYVSYTVQTAFGCSGIAEYPATAVSLVDRITFPDSSFYSFSYEATPGTPTHVTGRLASVTLPTGGTISYAYTGGSAGITCADGSAAGLTRTTTAVSGSSGSTVTYARSSAGAGLSHTNLTDGLGNVSQYDFVLPANYPSITAQLYPTEVKSYQGAASGTPLLATATCYNSTASSCATVSFSLPVTSITKTSIHDGIQQAQAIQTFDSQSGMLTSSQVCDFGSGNCPAMLMQQSTPVSILANGMAVPTQSVVSDSSGTYSKVVYGYDETSVGATSGVPSHISLSGAAGNLTSMTISTGPSSTYLEQALYVDTGNATLIFDPVDGTTSAGFDPTYVYNTGVFPQTMATGFSLSTSAAFDTANTGLPTSTTAANGSTTSVYYDSMLRQTEIDYPDGGKTTFTYAPSQISQFRIMSAGTEDTETILDAYGRTIRTAIANGQGGGQPWYEQDTCYDANGNVSFKSYRYQASSLTGSPVCSGAGDTYSYDALGRSLAVQHASSPLTYLEWAYLGRTTKTVDENGVTKLTQVDGAGRISAVCEVTSVTLPNSGAPASCGMDIAGTGYLTTYSYSLANHTTTITQGGQQRVFQTDWIGRTTSVQEPESGTTTYSYSSNSTGLVVTRVKPKANQALASIKTTTTTQYDLAGRILSIVYNDGTPTKTFVYDQAAATAGGSPSLGSSIGYLTSFSTGNTQGFYGYDPMGRVKFQTNCQPVNCASGAYTAQNYTYDTIGNLLTAGDGTGRTVTYTYTLASEPATVISSPASGPSTPLASAAQYGPFGPTAISLGNGLTAVSSYDSVGVLNGRWVCGGTSSTFCAGGTQMYGVGVIKTGGRVSVVSDTALNQGVSFGYDDMNRLASRTVGVGATQNFSYSYDRWGNRTQQTAFQTGPTVSSTFNTANNQIQTANGYTYTYDAAGNVWSDGIYIYAYDAEGNITGVSGSAAASYVYNAINQRVETVTSSGTEQFNFHPNGQRAATLDGTGAVVSEQAYLGSQPLAFLTAGSFHYQHQDWLGTERVRTSASGSVEGSFTSLPFGDYYFAAGSDQDPSHYTGLDEDSETGTIHAPFRQYAPVTGTWMRPDPYTGSYDPGNPQSLNRYAYVMNSPLSYRDPLGLYLECGGPTHIKEVQSFNGVEQDSSEYDEDDANCWFVEDGGGGGGGGGTAPSNKPQTRQQCLANWKNSTAGKVAGFLSLYRLGQAVANIRTDPKEALKAGAEWTVLPYLKVKALGGLTNVASSVGSQEFLSITSGGVAATIESPTALGIVAAEGIGLEVAPLAIGLATFVDYGMQQACNNLPPG